MGQTGWRLPDDLLKRVRVHCAQTGERQNEFVRQALEKALADGAEGEPRTALVIAHETEPAPSRTPAKPKVVSGEVTFNETYTRPGSQRLGKGFVPPRPKGK